MMKKISTMFVAASLVGSFALAQQRAMVAKPVVEKENTIQRGGKAGGVKTQATKAAEAKSSQAQEKYAPVTTGPAKVINLQDVRDARAGGIGKASAVNVEVAAPKAAESAISIPNAPRASNSNIETSAPMTIGQREATALVQHATQVARATGSEDAAAALYDVKPELRQDAALVATELYVPRAKDIGKELAADAIAATAGLTNELGAVPNTPVYSVVDCKDMVPAAMVRLAKINPAVLEAVKAHNGGNLIERRNVAFNAMAKFFDGEIKNSDITGAQRACLTMGVVPSALKLKLANGGPQCRANNPLAYNAPANCK